MNQLVGWNSWNSWNSLAVTYCSYHIKFHIFKKQLQLKKRLQVDLFEFVLNKTMLAMLALKAYLMKANKNYQTFTSSGDRTGEFVIAI